MKAIIAAGGKGTRLRPLTFTSNKHLIPIANKPLILYPIEDLAQLGIKEVGIIVNETRLKIENLLGSGKKWKIKITYIDQPEPLGLAHVVKISEKFLNKSPFIYHLGDNIFTKGIKKPFTDFVQTKSDALLTIVEHQENYRLGVPFFKNGKLVKVVEKPKNAPNKFGVPGLYFFSHNVFKAFRGKDAIKPSKRGELEIVDLYNYLIKKGYRVNVSQIKGRWLDPGKFDDSLEANKILLDLKIKNKIKGKLINNSKISGRVEIGKKSVIDNSTITGPVSVGENVYIQNSIIGPYTSIASNCEIRNSALENSIVMKRADIIDVNTRIQDSMIGKDAILHGRELATPSYSFTISDMSIVELPR